MRNRCPRVWALAACGILGASAASIADSGEAERLEHGKRLFFKEWVLGEKSPYGGDGLGPLFNARSCAACHQQGGDGGAGGIEANVSIATMPVSVGEVHQLYSRWKADPKSLERSVADFQLTFAWQSAAMAANDNDRRTAFSGAMSGRLSANQTPEVFVRSFVLHSNGSDPAYRDWLASFNSFSRFEGPLGRRGPVQPNSQVGCPAPVLAASNQNVRITRVTERNSPTIQGAGLIDRIPDAVFEKVAAEQAAQASANAAKGPAGRAKTKRQGASKAASADLAVPSGRVPRLPDGSVGRFGWKGQASSLHEFTLSACAIELGLEVPGRSQIRGPWSSVYQAPGIDLSEADCKALSDYLASLPAPKALHAAQPVAAIGKDLETHIKSLDDPDRFVREHAIEKLSAYGKEAMPAIAALSRQAHGDTPSVRKAASELIESFAQLDSIAVGERLFDSAGCAVCHRPNMGEVRGIYSDLLLHDMGDLVDSAAGIGFGSGGMGGYLASPAANVLAQRTVISGRDLEAGEGSGPPSSAEWRTPPLWGCRDTAPYLHDGRAADLEAAIRGHGGEAKQSANRFSKMSDVERRTLIAFLRSIGAPADEPKAGQVAASK